MGIPLIQLHLDAPLQSWGIKSKWLYHRDTCHEPTKSGVVGLISGALGLQRDDKEIENLNRNLKMGVRIEREAIRVRNEFQTIKGGYFGANHKFIKDSIILNKDYLENAFFLVVLEGKKSLLNKISSALKSPVYSPSLGRKCCIPTSRIYAGYSEDHGSIKEALEKIEWSLEWRIKHPKYFVVNKIPEKLRCMMDDPQGTITKYDVRLINDAKIRNFTFRKVTEFFVKTPLKDLTEEKMAEASNVLV